MNKTPKGFTYIPVTCNPICVCDFCNQNIQHGYLVFILSRCICSRCLNEWITRPTTLTQEEIDQDLQLQHDYQDSWYATQLSIGHLRKED
jgi:hypothetical protein